MNELPTRMSERFTLAEVIGRGTCSTVFRARDELLDRDVAVKIFPVTDDPRVEREVSLLASLDHPALVPVYDVGQVDGRAFVVMALFDGGDLADRLAADGPLPLSEALLTAAAVADALAHVHRAGVLHRDVIPRNVLFDVDGRAHLSDFGVAFVADAPRITDTGIVVGSAPYLAPEQVRGEAVGPTADVYALGLVMIEALTGRPAYEGAPLEAAQARLDHPPVLPPGLPEDVTDLIDHMTADDPADRPGAEAACRRMRQAALAGELAAGDPRRDLVGAGVVTDLTARTSRTARPVTGGARRVRRGSMVLGAATLSLLLASGVVIASTGPVGSVAATMQPEAGLTAPTMAAPAPAFVAPVIGGATDDDSSGSSESSDSGTTAAEPTRTAESRRDALRYADPSVVANSSPIRSADRAGTASVRPAAPPSASTPDDDATEPTEPTETREADGTTTPSPTTTTSNEPSTTTSPRPTTTTSSSTSSSAPTTTTEEKSRSKDRERSSSPRSTTSESPTSESPTSTSKPAPTTTSEKESEEDTSGDEDSGSDPDASSGGPGLLDALAQPVAGVPGG